MSDDFEQVEPGSLENVVDPAGAAMRGQVEAAWQMMLSQATAAGFTREQIITLTLDTAAVILDSTAKALWPDDEIPASETYAWYAYDVYRTDLRNDAAYWQKRANPEEEEEKPLTE